MRSPFDCTLDELQQKVARFAGAIQDEAEPTTNLRTLSEEELEDNTLDVLEGSDDE